jgi:hypothetical protein
MTRNRISVLAGAAVLAIVGLGTGVALATGGSHARRIVPTKGTLSVPLLRVVP